MLERLAGECVVLVVFGWHGFPIVVDPTMHAMCQIIVHPSVEKVRFLGYLTNRKVGGLDIVGNLQPT